MSTPTQLIHTEFVRGQAVPAGGIDLRSGTFANPFPCGIHGVSLAQAHRHFVWWLSHSFDYRAAQFGSVSDADTLIQDARTLRGKRLYCDCPARGARSALCHGSVLARIADEDEFVLTAMEGEKPPQAVPRKWLCVGADVVSAMDDLGQSSVLRRLEAMSEQMPSRASHGVSEASFYGRNYSGVVVRVVSAGVITLKAKILTGLQSNYRSRINIAEHMQTQLRTEQL